jgi:hypothetical protein
VGAGSEWGAAVRRAWVAALAILPLPWIGVATGSDEEDSCVECHRDPKFLVTNKKLYDYFREWDSSVHEQEGIGCADCHGGNPKSSDKDKAHGTDLSESGAKSAVNFKNIPVTCGECHDEVYGRYRTSSHFEHLVAEAQEEQGPNCVTCHGSLSGTTLTVNTVRTACARCHNEKTDNHPEIPDKAKIILNKFLSIHRFYRYITARGDPIETREFFRRVDDRIHSLSLEWHTFELAGIEEKTQELLDLMKTKRDQVRKRNVGNGRR